MNKSLSQYFSLNRRYSRSINLERDLEKIEAIVGYIPTERSLDATKRIIAGLTGVSNHRAWTLTSVYGTGKSAFAHFLASLCAPQSSPMRSKALEIAATAFGTDSADYLALKEKLPSQGLFRAVATAGREPLSNTIIRALYRGAELFWTPQQRSKLSVHRLLVDLNGDITNGATIDSRRILKLVQEIATISETSVLLIIDELGKNLEFAVQSQGAEDLYLFQQLAELPQSKNIQVYLFGLLHQSFADYGERLASVQKSEWAKIQGRFEDISFKDSPAQMIRLIGQAIDSTGAEKILCTINNQAEKWFEHLPSEVTDNITASVLAAAYPLHPISALVLPLLCSRYAQNDRSLFTFLTSYEPYSFRNYLEQTAVEGDILPTLKLERVYDYFIEAVGMGLASRPNHSRWVEIQNLIADAQRQDVESLKVLKTIGILNLVTTTGSLRATRSLVKLALCDRATDSSSKHWEQVVESLLQKGVVTSRRQLDELRIWQGSDFNVDVELTAYLEKERAPLVKLLSDIRPLTPMVAQRHSYKTGTLRYFERRYLDGLEDLNKLQCSYPDSDGLMGYWVDREFPSQVSAMTADGKPLIIVEVAKLDLLQIRAREFAALKKIQTSSSELQTDGVARSEVRYRLVQAEQLLDETLSWAFDVAANQSRCWIGGKKETTISHITDFNAKLSDICDEVYSQGLILWNELINRRTLTSQGAKARRELIEAMLEHPKQEKLSLQGYGPETSMFFSVLGETGIHQIVDGDWGFYPPQEESGVLTVWQTIEDFCLQAKEKPQTLDNLYKLLEAPPYGVKHGVIPLLLAAVLLHHVDDIGVYKDGTFIAVLGAEHFELLVKDPSRFAIKYFEVVGLRAQVFKELESILRKQDATIAPEVRNSTLLMVVKPLFQFVKKLPVYTTKTKRLSPQATAVLQTLQQAQEPDELLFTALPIACGLLPIQASEETCSTTTQTLRKKLISALHEIQTAYERLLSECQSLLYNAFAVRTGEQKLREDLRVRASYLSGQCLERRLKSFVQAAADETVADKEWLEALVMIVADKPAESWTDEDVTGFEIKLSDLARRFKNLEALQKDAETRTGDGFDARKITITRPDGQEIHSLIWFDHERNDLIDGVVEEVLGILNKHDNLQLQQAVVAKLTERILRLGSQDKLSQMQAKPQNRKDEQEIG
ncbi:hypothetical protein [Chlorogloea sp. CCALA 695]|uniref:hypothetical protein n=1 Tax=Chlorogloea sp. CCALA 695 TaxID=2107693 RepID=UPI000D04901E|nr:hypothetical protein [Chlorogloea sp. CCALA 695]PSB31333.1 hypothetical protein C7B70_13450 [Chlorogloea sp. CCALA 695]